MRLDWKIRGAAYLFEAGLSREERGHLHRPPTELAHAERGLALVQQVSSRNLLRPLLGGAEGKVDDIAI